MLIPSTIYVILGKIFEKLFFLIIIILFWKKKPTLKIFGVNIISSQRNLGFKEIIIVQMLPKNLYQKLRKIKILKI